MRKQNKEYEYGIDVIININGKIDRKKDKYTIQNKRRREKKKKGKRGEERQRDREKGKKRKTSKGETRNKGDTTSYIIYDKIEYKMKRNKAQEEKKDKKNKNDMSFTKIKIF